MPILWRFLMRNFLQVFFLSVSGFIAVLLVTRFQSIARFAATGACFPFVLQFILAQIPHILPLAIPISCLIASFLLFQRMSHSHELTALRVAGLGLTVLTFPLALLGITIALINFTIASEISPRCKSFSKHLAYQMAAINPFCLLQKGSPIKLRGTYANIKRLKPGEYVEDVCFITRNTVGGRLNLVLAKKLALDGDQMIGNNVSVISSIDTKNPHAFDHLIVENQAEMHTQVGYLSQYLTRGRGRLHVDYLNCRMIQAKRLVENGSVADVPPRIFQEMARRFSLALASLSFTFVGMASGFEIGRRRRLRGLLFAAILMAVYLITFVTAKSLKHHLSTSLIMFAFPHPILWAYCVCSFRRISQGLGS